MDDFFVLIGGFNVKTILVLHTGGTISMSEDQTTGKVSPTSENPLKSVVIYLIMSRI